MLLTFWCSSGKRRFMEHCPWDGLEGKSHSWAALFPGLK